jgi:hypothetical protein
MGNRAKQRAKNNHLTEFQTSRVAAVFGRYPAEIRERLLQFRKLIFDAASSLEGVGPIEETLRWGEPSYLTTQSGSGSMVRINQLPREARAFAVYFHCQTNLVETFRRLYGRRLSYLWPSCKRASRWRSPISKSADAAQSRPSAEAVERRPFAPLHALPAGRLGHDRTQSRPAATQPILRAERHVRSSAGRCPGCEGR